MSAFISVIKIIYCGLVSLFNSMSTFEGDLIPNPSLQLDNSGTI